MKKRLLLAGTVTAGLVFAPSAFAQDTTKPGISKKVHKTAKALIKVQKKADRAPGKIRKNDDMGSPYSTQKDEMTR
jgi:hypothetical protein